MCKPCEARRKKLAEALSRKDALAAVAHAAKGAAEMVGIKKKPDDSTRD